MKPIPSLIAAACAAVALLAPRPARAQAEIPADFLSIIGDTAGTLSDGYGSPGSIPVRGRDAFPVLIDSGNLPALAAGRAANGSRAVAAAHTGFFNTSNNTTSKLFVNSILWASRKTVPSTIRVGSNSSTIRTFLAGKGFLTKTITTSMSTTTNDLSTCDVFVGDFHSGFSATAISKIIAFAATNDATGGGVVVCSTPWALNAQPFADAQAVLEPFGLSVSGSGTNAGSFTVAAASYPAYHSALNGLDQLLSGPAMTLAEKVIAAGAVDRVLAVRPQQADVIAGLDSLEGSYGTITLTGAAPLVKASKPVEAMLARFQSGKFDALTAAGLFAHPSASDWPGSPAAGSTVSKTFTVNGTVPADVFMNQGSRGRRVETRLYAAPGATLTVTIPADKVAAGVVLDIGCHIDENFHLDRWNRFPKVTRRIPLTQVTTQTGNVFGGIVWIVVPAGASLGNFDVTISGALEAPCFQLGVDTDATWNATLKNLPGAWGCIMTENVPGYGNTPAFTAYVSRTKLQGVTSAEAVAQHWKKVMETADDRMGYTAFRKRGESALSDRDILAGGGHAGYPVMMAYGDSDVLVDDALKNGDWGYYHELGHTFQDSFDGNYGIATHGEVDVNLVPALLHNLVHDNTCWDGDIHGTFNGGNRLSKRTAFMALAPASQLWGTACGDGATGYDFYFNLSEAFGWTAYRTALSRLMAWHQGGTDAALSSFSGTSDQAKRNRFYVIFCDATGRNLDTYFQRYGIGVTGRGYEISQTAKDHIAAKSYPVWIDNSPVDSIGDPGVLTASESVAAGTLIADLSVSDAEEPGSLFTWSITSGNTEGRVLIDKRTGELKVSASGLDREKVASYSLGIQVDDGGVNRTTVSRTVTVNVGNVVEGPLPGGTAVLNATSVMGAGTVLGQAIIADVTRTLTAVSILSGNGSGAFAVNASGQLVLQTPAALPAASVLTLVVSGTDSAGAGGYAIVRVLANGTPGLREQRWTGTTKYTTNTWTGATSYTGSLTSSTSTENVAENYSRRLLGWLVPPVSGEYTFWVSGDDDCRFYLGTDETEASRVLMGRVSGYTNFQSFDGQGGQRSLPVSLEAGKAYWFEAQQMEGGGGDHVSVAWQGAGIGTRAIVAGAYLVPNQAGVAMSNDLPDPPVFTADPIVKAGGMQGVAYSGTLSGEATDPDGGTLIYSKITGPTWLAVASNGALSGTPTNDDVGLNSLVVKVTDPTGLSDQADLPITVANVNDAPVFTVDPIAGGNATEGAAFTGSVAATAGDIDGDALTYSKENGPPWLIVAADGSMSGTPPPGSAGSNAFTIRASDGSAFDLAALVIEVEGGASPFSNWIGGIFGDVTDPAVIGPDADPDHDGDSNAIEFALGGLPNSTADRAKVFARTEDSSDSGTARELVLTIAVLKDTPGFSGNPSPAASYGGYTVTVEGSIDLGGFSSAVSVVEPLVTNLDDAPDGYEYRSFKLDVSDELAGRGFLRVEVKETE
ncbi:M60 family metallopeptidase [Luteolibacter sp. Populi]|uniref:M60 family metallopeptidase n=1 Tax=Luteolibacter sp. Populi TaxID=3230487 RepID=UPI003467E4F0